VRRCNIHMQYLVQYMVQYGSAYNRTIYVWCNIWCNVAPFSCTNAVRIIGQYMYVLSVHSRASSPAPPHPRLLTPLLLTRISSPYISSPGHRPAARRSRTDWGAAVAQPVSFGRSAQLNSLVK
jgi:hypothetical protein